MSDPVQSLFLPEGGIGAFEIDALRYVRRRLDERIAQQYDHFLSSIADQLEQNGLAQYSTNPSGFTDCFDWTEAGCRALEEAGLPADAGYD